MLGLTPATKLGLEFLDPVAELLGFTPTNLLELLDLVVDSLGFTPAAKPGLEFLDLVADGRVRSYHVVLNKSEPFQIFHPILKLAATM